MIITIFSAIDHCVIQTAAMLGKSCGCHTVYDVSVCTLTNQGETCAVEFELLGLALKRFRGVTIFRTATAITITL